MLPILRSLIAKVASRRNFSSSPMSVEPKGEKRVLSKLIGVTTVGVGCDLGALVIGKELLRRKAERNSAIWIPGDECIANRENYLIEVVQGKSKVTRKTREEETLIPAKEFMESPCDYLFNVIPKQ